MSKNVIDLTNTFLILDHMIRLIDVRNFSEPFLTLKGHRKAVSYVNFISDNELVSA